MRDMVERAAQSNGQAWVTFQTRMVGNDACLVLVQNLAGGSKHLAAVHANVWVKVVVPHQLSC